MNMLNIYIGEDNIKSGLKKVTDNDLEFNLVGLSDTEDVRMILRDIEQGEYVDEYKFKDRFGVMLYPDVISTGSKTLINISCGDSSKVYSGAELGANARRVLMKLNNGNVYFREHFDRLSYQGIPVIVNGTICDDDFKFDEVMYNV
jgi:hypothetical protein